MKKKFLALVLACSMVFAMTACGKDDEKEPTTVATPDVDIDNIEVPDIDAPDSTDAPDTTEAADVATPATSDNEVTINGIISLSLEGTDYELYTPSSNDTTKVYSENNQLQTVAISAMSTTGMVGVEAQFKGQIENVYGTNYKNYDVTFNGITFTAYDFGTNNIMSSDISVIAYVYVGDGVAVYAEEAWATQLGASSGDTEKVMNTITLL